MTGRLFAAAAAALLAACASAPQMPADMAAKVKAIGPVIDPPKTAVIYAPLQENEPYKGVRVLRDLEYGPDPRHLLDVFMPEKVAAPAPVLVFVHGGGFIRGSKRTPGSPFYDNIMLAAARAGFIGVNATYRLAPEHRWPAGAEDVGDAVRWVRANIAAHGGDPKRITLMGHSAGAVHVASYLAFPEHHDAGGVAVARAILVSGLYDFTKMGQPGPPEQAYFGKQAGTAEVSSLQGLTKSSVPLMVVYGGLDPAPFIEQSKLLNDALCAAGKCPRLLYLPAHSHMSEVYSINTADKSVSEPIFDFAKSR
jgi:triacylglycerol lipase